ncbi:MAG TPA: glutamine--fructose-6-phosphate transaminase (isomerizing) [Candidatus Woesebacteria bacterium]|nr:glutamine--fructose-6-phosphate transaminase (isomerizing) [Candidatus Woesebacteria bacterium]
MCGIFGYVSRRPVATGVVFTGLKELEYRGYDSWGIVWETKKGLGISKHLGKMDQKPDRLPKSSISLGHTRWATHGGITFDNCHPHFDCTGNIAVVHNGIIENYQELKAELIKKGHRFTSETDSEVIAHLVEELGSVKSAFKKLKGANAISVLIHGRQEIVIAKAGSPLVVGLGQGINYVASDPNPLLPYTNKFIFLDDGEVLKINSQEIKSERIKIIQPPAENLSSSLGKYPNYLIKEISEQPKILKIINDNYDLSPLRKIFKLIKSKDRVFFTGCGTAYFAALFSANWLSRRLKKPIFCSPASEFGAYLDSFNKNDLLVAFSQSGETADLINLFNLARPKQITLTSIVNAPYSTLHRISVICQLLPCGPEKCVLSTKSFTAHIALFFKLLNFDLNPAITALKSVLTNNNLKPLAEILKNKQHIYLIGRGLSLPIALESALKIKEVSYIHAEAFAGAELKHGSIALIENGTPCLVLAPQDETYNDVISNATEIKARGGYLIGLSAKPHPVFDYFISVPDCGPATALPQVAAAQLLAYHLCQLKGLDPDKPRNLAKSVTVK